MDKNTKNDKINNNINSNQNLPKLKSAKNISDNLKDTDNKVKKESNKKEVTSNTKKENNNIKKVSNNKKKTSKNKATTNNKTSTKKSTVKAKTVKLSDSDKNIIKENKTNKEVGIDKKEDKNFLEPKNTEQDTEKDKKINIISKEEMKNADKVRENNAIEKEKNDNKELNNDLKTEKTFKSPKRKKDVIKETNKKIPKENIIIKDNSSNKDKNYKNELKDINNNKEFAKAIWDTDDITEAIKIEENNQEKLNDEIEEMLIKEKKYNFFEPFIIIVLLIVCFLGLYFILFTKDSAIINSALTNINTNLTNSLSQFNTIKEELNKGISGTATLDTTNSDYAKLKDFTYNFSLYNKNNNYYGNILLSKDEQSINNTYSYLDKNLYIKTPLYYYPIEISNPIKVNPLSINYSNLNNNIEVIKNYLTNNIHYTKSKKDKEELNGEKLSVLILDFSEYDFNNSIQSILKAIGSDTELLKSMAKNIGLDEVTITDLFNQNIQLAGNYQIKIYTKGFLQTFYGIKIYNDDKEVLEYLTDGNTTLNIYGDKKTSINISNDKLLIYVNDIKLIDIKSNKNKKDLINLDFQISNILDNYQGSIVLTKEDSNKGSFLFSFKNTNNNDSNAEIKMDLVFEANKENTFDYTDAVLIDDITEEELADIKNNLFNVIWEQVSNPEAPINDNNEVTDN